MKLNPLVREVLMMKLVERGFEPWGATGNFWIRGRILVALNTMGSGVNFFEVQGERLQDKGISGSTLRPIYWEEREALLKNLMGE